MVHFAELCVNTVKIRDMYIFFQKKCIIEKTASILYFIEKEVMAMSIFKVICHTGINNNGFIQYDTDTKDLTVKLNDTEKEEQVRQYLTQERVMHRYTDLSLYDHVSAVPVSSLENLKLGLCRIWFDLGVHIDWSRPVE